MTGDVARTNEPNATVADDSASLNFEPTTTHAQQSQCRQGGPTSSKAPCSQPFTDVFTEDTREKVSRWSGLHGSRSDRTVTAGGFQASGSSGSQKVDSPEQGCSVEVPSGEIGQQEVRREVTRFERTSATPAHPGRKPCPPGCIRWLVTDRYWVDSAASDVPVDLSASDAFGLSELVAAAESTSRAVLIESSPGNSLSRNALPSC